LIISTESPH